MAPTSAQDYGEREADFYDHYQKHGAEQSGSYEQHRPAYRYGYDLGLDPHYGRYTWSLIELEARTGWEARNPGTWEQFKDSIHYAWTTVAASVKGIIQDDP